MMGASDPPELKGLCPRTIDAIFEEIDAHRDQFDFTVTAYMIEVFFNAK